MNEYAHTAVSIGGLNAEMENYEEALQGRELGVGIHLALVVAH